jgi:hypothetical protein
MELSRLSPRTVDHEQLRATSLSPVRRSRIRKMPVCRNVRQAVLPRCTRSISIATVRAHPKLNRVPATSHCVNCQSILVLADPSNPKLITPWRYAVKSEPAFRICVAPRLRLGLGVAVQPEIDNGPFQCVSGLGLRHSASHCAELRKNTYARNFDGTSKGSHGTSIAPAGGHRIDCWGGLA